MNRSIALSLSLLAAACSSPTTSPDAALADVSATTDATTDAPRDGVTAVMSLAADLTNRDQWYDLPWPSDLRLNAMGQPDYRGFPFPGSSSLVRGVLEIAGDRQGFTALPVAYFRFDGPLAALATGRALVESNTMVKGGPLSRASLDAGAAFAAGMDVGIRAAEQCSSTQLDCVCGAIGAGRSLDTHAGLAWAWMEATLRAPIALWDALGFAHGPLQAIYEREAVLLGFERDAEDERALFDRVESVLVRERHTLIRLKAPQRNESAVFAHAGAVWGLLLSLLAARPRDLRTWPAKGRDGALYELDGR